MITISRPDITHTHLQEFDPNTRFIKLPIAPYLKLAKSPGGAVVFDELNAPQVGLINALNSPNYRFIVAAFSRRLGKTFIANIIGQLVVLIPNCHVLIMSPNYNLSTISFELQRFLIRQFDIEVSKDNQKDRVIELVNGSTVRMGSVTTVDSCVGRSYDLIIFDEAALDAAGKDAFNVSLRPTLDKINSKCVFISTPRGRTNWFSEFYNRGYSSEYSSWISLHADWTENTRMSNSDVEEARTSMSSAEFEQEYMANFNTYEGQIFKFSYDQVVNCEPEPHWEWYGGLDPGYRDPTAMVVVAYDPNKDCFWVVDEYLKSESTTELHAQAIKGFIDRYGLEGGIFIDSAAAQFAGDLAYTYDISTIKAKKDVLPGIAYVQTLVEQNRLFVHSRCVNTLKMLGSYQWNSNKNLLTEKPVHDIHSHLADALRYCLYSIRL